MEFGVPLNTHTHHIGAESFQILVVLHCSTSFRKSDNTAILDNRDNAFS